MSTHTRRRALCACGKTLFYLLDTPASALGFTQIDCGRCQYLVWRMYKARGEVLPKRHVLVVHTIAHADGAILQSETLTMDADSGHAMRARPTTDLSEALTIG